MNEEELLRKLRGAFRGEARERLASMSAGLLELEKTSEPDRQKAVLEVVFREAHSLKGAARAVNLVAIESLCQSAESVFAALKEGPLPRLSPDFFDTLHDAVCAVENLLSSEDEDGEGQEEIGRLIGRLADMGKVVSESRVSETDGHDALPPTLPGPDPSPETGIHEPPPAPPRGPVPPESDECVPDGFRAYHDKPLFSDTVRISSDKLNGLLLKAEELSSLKLVSDHHLLNIRHVMGAFDQWKKKWTQLETEHRFLRKYLEKEKETEDRETAVFDSSLSGLISFSDWSYKHMQSLSKKIGLLKKSAEHERRMLSRMTDDLLDDMKTVMMLPFSRLFEMFPRMVRSILRDKDKEARLLMEGGEIEIDRRILEEMKDPLIHLLRNAIDHGLESPRERSERGKKSAGLIRLLISRPESGKVEITVSDDGGGIDSDSIRKRAAESGVISQSEAEGIGDKEALWLIFRSGVSSSRIITDISGRGLGLAIVREKVEKLGGLLSVETLPGKGTSFRIRLPVTLATFRGVLVRTSGRLFILPGACVERVMNIPRERIGTVENRATLAVKGEVIALTELAAVLGLPGKGVCERESVTVMILEAGRKRMAFGVSEIVCEQEVLVKGLGRQLSRVPYISGATILGTGEVVPILNVHDLLKAPSCDGDCLPGTEDRETTGPEAEPQKKRSILIAEDSITSRMLIKNILESAGYAVRAVADGREAYTLLRTEDFDALVSDVEMPRMNGFELTEKIRGNERLSELPVVLITSLDSREELERGIDVGANAYIVKSSFDRSNLLDVIGRLV